MTLCEQLLGHTLLQPDDRWGLLTIMCVSVALSVGLEQKYRWASRMSGAMIALILAMVMANLGILPISCTLYDDIVWSVAVPMGIPLLLLRCNMKKIWRETGRILAVFLIGAVGTVVGAFLAFYLLREPFGDAQGLAQVAAMMTGSYIGGSVNFAAMAATFGAADDLKAAAVVADNFLMAGYFFVLIAFSGMRFFRKNYAHPHIDAMEAGTGSTSDRKSAAAFWGGKDISLKDIACDLAYAAAVVWIANVVAGGFTSLTPKSVHSVGDALLDFTGRFLGSEYVWITTISVLVATFGSRQAEKLHGSQEIGTYLIHLFLFVIGVPANVITVLTKSPLLLAFTFLMVVVNMIFCFGAAKIFRFDLEEAIIASNANIGGPTTAAGMAVSQGWAKLAGPAMLVGALGYVIGNYAGTVVGIILGA